MYSGLTYGLKEARGAHDWVRFLFTVSWRIPMINPSELVYIQSYFLAISTGD